MPANSSASLRSHTLILAVSNIGTALLSFLLAVVIARSLGESGLGAYAVALAWVMPLSLLVEFGVGTLITRETAAHLLPPSSARIRTESRQGDLLAVAVRARLVLGTPLALLLIGAAPLLSSDIIIARGIQLSAPLLLIQPLFSTYSAVFRGHGQMYPIPWLNIGMLAVQLCLTLLILGGAGYDECGVGVEWCDQTGAPALVLDVLVVNTLTSAAQLAACWGIYRVRFYEPARGSRPSVLMLLRQSWDFGLAALFAAVQVRMSTVLLEGVSGVAAAGLYSGANRFIEAARLLPNAYYGALFPRLGALEKDVPHMRQVFRRALLVSLAYGIAAALCLSLLGHCLLTIAYGEEFIRGAPVLTVLSAGFCFSVLRGTLTLFRYAQRRESFVNRVNFFVIGVQLVLCLGLIPQLGAAGAAWAVLGTEAFACAALGFLAPPDARALGDDDVVFPGDKFRQ